MNTIILTLAVIIIVLLLVLLFIPKADKQSVEPEDSSRPVKRKTIRGQKLTKPTSYKETTPPVEEEEYEPHRKRATEDEAIPEEHKEKTEEDTEHEREEREREESEIEHEESEAAETAEPAEIEEEYAEPTEAAEDVEGAETPEAEDALDLAPTGISVVTTSIFSCRRSRPGAFVFP